jgi:hypothetical protein
MPRWSQVPLVRQVQLGARSKWARQTAALVTLLLILPVAAATLFQKNSPRRWRRHCWPSCEPPVAHFRRHVEMIERGTSCRLR